MDPEVIRQMLEGQEDILTPAAKAEDKLYQNTQCPICGERGCQKVIRAPKVKVNQAGEPELIESPFNSSDPLPQGHAQCTHCDTEFNPLTGMIFHSDASMIHAPE